MGSSWTWIFGHLVAASHFIAINQQTFVAGVYSYSANHYMHLRFIPKSFSYNCLGIGWKIEVLKGGFGIAISVDDYSRGSIGH